MKNLPFHKEADLISHVIDLASKIDSFDQLSQLAQICDLLYSHEDPVYSVIYEAIEKTARHLRGLPIAGVGVNTNTTAGLTSVNNCRCDDCLAGFMGVTHGR